MKQPTFFESLIHARIHLSIFGVYLGTGHLNSYDTDSDYSDSDYSDSD